MTDPLKFTSRQAFQAAVVFLFVMGGGWPCTGNAQSTASVQTLRQTGPMPEQVWNLAHGVEVFRPLEQDEYYQQVRAVLNPWATFLVRRIAYSGKLVYGDPLSRYCQVVANSLFKNQTTPALRCYLLVESSPDAFALSNGMVFLHTGLISRLENEAQLAFVLAHEMAHIRLGHLHQTMLAAADPKQWTDRQEAQAPDIHQNPEWEKAADLFAMNIYLKAGYPAHQAYRARMLTSANWSEADFAWPLKEPAPAVAVPEAELLADYWLPFASPGSTEYGSPAIPADLRRLARQSVASAFLHDQQYLPLLGWLAAHPDTEHKETLEAYAWYCLLRYQWAGKWWEVVPVDQELPTTLTPLPEKLQNQDDLAWMDAVGKAMAEAVNIDHSDAWVELMATNLLHHAEIPEWEKIAYWKKWLPQLPIPDLFPEPHFSQNILIAQPDRPRQESQQVKKGFALGINHLLVADPAYLAIDLRNSIGVKFRESMRSENLISQSIILSGKTLGMDITVLSAYAHQPYDLSLLDEMVTINTWLSARWQFGDLDILPYNELQKSLILKKYGAEGLLSTGIFAQTDAHRLPAYHLALGVMVPPYLPWALYFSLSPDQKVIFDASVYLPQNPQPALIYRRTMRIPDFDDLTESFIYDLLFQIQR